MFNCLPDDILITVVVFLDLLEPHDRSMVEPSTIARVWDDYNTSNCIINIPEARPGVPRYVEDVQDRYIERNDRQTTRWRATSTTKATPLSRRAEWHLSSARPKWRDTHEEGPSGGIHTRKPQGLET